jgi:hypothetical protein
VASGAARTDFFPATTNDRYAGSRLSVWFLGLAALLTIGPGLIHSFAPDGGAVSIGGLKLGADRALVIGVFRWEGATQLAFGLSMLAVAIRYRTLTPLFLALVALESGLLAVQAWLLAPPPADGHRPPENYGALAVVPASLLFLALSLKPRTRVQ